MKIANLTILYILLILFIPFSLSFLIRETPNKRQPSLEGTQRISAGVTLTQFFTSEMANLSGIGTSIKNPYNQNRKNLILNLYSQDKILRTINLNGSNIADGDFIIIRFEPILDSKGKSYSLQLSAADSTSGESLEAFLTSQSVSWIGDLYVNSDKLDAKMSFVTYHKPINLFSVIKEIFVQFVNRLFADLFFALFYTLLLGTLAGYLIYLNRENK